MGFTSPTFALFLLGVVVAYAVCGARLRWIVLLLASAWFYSLAGVTALCVLSATIVIGYAGARLVASTAETTRRWSLFCSIAMALAVLCFFKYPRSASPILLPLGLSFFVLQTIAYLVDVHRGVVVAETNLARYALGVAFFPRIVIGPIERAAHLGPQLRQLGPIRAANLSSGLFRILVGLVKKLVIADRLAFVLHPILDGKGAGSNLVLFATYAYVLQIYFDFSGYTDIALGAARLFGVGLSENFKRPLLATSIAEFWRRWHITLLTWFRDYVFIPLAGLRGRGWKLWGTILIVFALSGLWHGARITFLVWGVIHGVYMVCSELTNSTTRRIDARVRGTGWAGLLKWTRTAYTFHLVVLADIFFRAGTLGEAMAVLKRVTWGWQGAPWREVAGQVVAIPSQKIYAEQYFAFAVLFPTILALGFLAKEMLVERAWGKRLEERVLANRWSRWIVVSVAISLVCFFGYYETAAPLYAQF